MKAYTVRHKEDTFNVTLNALDFEDALEQITKSGVTKKDDWIYVSVGPAIIYRYIRHVSSELIQGRQHCVICGALLTDYRNAMTDKPGPMNGFPAGPIFVSKSKNPTVYMVDIPDDDYHLFDDCKGKR